MPYRLLGLVADPDQVGDICGKAFAHYAASGADITLVCAAPGTASYAELRNEAGKRGVRQLILLDFGRDELTTPDLVPLIADIMTGAQPHVVVVGAGRGPIRDAAVEAFQRSRRAASGSAALPARLYARLSASAPSIGVTSAVAVGEGAAPERFGRIFPEPWLTGVIESDLFAGIQDRPPLDNALQIAS